MVMKYNAFTSAGDIRNDLYVTLEKGEFEKGNETFSSMVLFQDVFS